MKLDPITPNEHISVTRFRQYLRIKTVQPNPDYLSAKNFLTEYAKELNLPIQHIEIVQGKFISIISISGEGEKNEIADGVDVDVATENKRRKIPFSKAKNDAKNRPKSILLNSHIDVVPVYEQYWKYPPFSAYKDENNDIYARGAQDMKCVGIQYLEAIRKILEEKHEKDLKWTPERDIHVMFVPEEEVGGIEGMKKFVNEYGDFIKNELNVGFELDEGLASTGW